MSPYFYLGSPFPLDVLPFSPFSLLPPVVSAPLPPSCVCLSAPLPIQKVLFHHFKCSELPLGLSPPSARADLCWKPLSPLQHPTPEAKETGRLCQKNVRVLGGEEGETARAWGSWEWETVTNFVSENCKNIDLSWWGISPHPEIPAFVPPVVSQNSCLLRCHGTGALCCLFVPVSAWRSLCYLN